MLGSGDRAWSLLDGVLRLYRFRSDLMYVLWFSFLTINMAILLSVISSSIYMLQ